MSNHLKAGSSGGEIKNLAVIIGAVAALIFLFILVFFATTAVNESKKKAALRDAQQQAQNNNQSTTTESSLPTLDPVGENNGTSSRPSDWSAENVSFGDFYKINREKKFFSLPDYTLPQNVKLDVANYYDVSRKVNLDAGLDSLNNNGFAVIDNQFSSEAGDFFQGYSVLSSKQVPVLVTSDFLAYYYQNTLKNAFKDLESTVFYENLWKTCKSLYARSKNRYEANLAKVGLDNDLALEGSRRELAFLATALQLLSPTSDQVFTDVIPGKPLGFSPSEAIEYSFGIPSYLKNDVEKEVALIRKSDETTKSPVLLYERNYKDFVVPNEYRDKARLKNFYLASRWLNSVFPLYYRGEDCPNCLLDRDDWRLSMYSALLLSEDFSADRDIQNNWAKIYKIKSFFQGLRGDLNYLHYRQAMIDIFGDDKKVEDVFVDSSKNDENFSLLKDELLSIEFSGVEGGLDKNSTTTKKFLGMKMLVDPYWPTEYIYNQLSYPHVGTSSLPNKDAAALSTSCTVPNGRGWLYRCRGMALDVINVVAKDITNLGGAYFSTNTDYKGYTSQAQKLRQQFANFTPLSWHNSNYWSNLDMISRAINSPDSERPIFMRNDDWRRQELIFGSSVWVNLQIPGDSFKIPDRENSARLGVDLVGGGAAEYGYIEPNLAFVSELKANTEMVFEMLKVLEVERDGSVVLVDLDNMRKNFEEAEMIINKELNSEELTLDDYKFIGSLTTLFAVKTKGARDFTVASLSSRSGMQEKVDGLKFKVITYYKDGKRYFAVGPVFNFWESIKK
jgi:hypothetical protein